MIAFEVKINGEVVCTAGVGEYGFLFTDVMWNKRNPALRPKGIRKKEWAQEQLRLRVSGLVAHDERVREQLQWTARSLSVGDEIVIHILEQPACDEPNERDRYDKTAMNDPKVAPRAKAKRKKRSKTGRR